MNRIKRRKISLKENIREEGMRKFLHIIGFMRLILWQRCTTVASSS